MLEQVGGESGSVAAGSFDRPDAATVGVLVGEGPKTSVADCVGSDLEVFDDAASRSVENCGGVGVAVGIDADDEVDGACQHGFHGASFRGVEFLTVGTGLGEVTVRQDCDEARP